MILKECPICNTYHDITVKTCPCGADLADVYADSVEDEILDLPDICGEINRNAPIYVQRCPVCRTENYTDSEQNSVKKCRYCQKLRIGQVVPILYTSGELHSEGDKPPKADGVFGGSSDDVPDHASDDAPRKDDWTKVLENIDGVVEIKRQREKRIAGEEEKSREAGESPDKKPATLRIIATGRFQGLQESFTAQDSPVLLGRYAGDILDAGDRRAEQYVRCEEFLQQDTRVSSYHCYIIYRDRQWFVHDGVWNIWKKKISGKGSTNSTRINDKVVTGDTLLFHGAILKLGNQPDSVQFLVEILE